MIAIPSNNLIATPSVVNTASDNQLVALDITGTYTGNTIVTENPARMLFFATGTGGIHLYGIDLTGASAPVPVQVSNITLPNINQYCAADTRYAEDNLNSPSTLWVVLHIDSTANCSSSSGVYEVVNYTDSSSTAPAMVSITGTDGFDAMYHSPSGALAGIVLPQGTNLNYYTSKAFTSPATLVSNIGTAADLADISSNGQDMLGESVAFYVVTNSSTSKLYRITTAPSATTIYTFQGQEWASSPRNDATNIYFSDGDATNFRIIKAPITTGAASQIYTTSAAGGTFALVGSNGSLFAFVENTTGGDGSVQTVSTAGGTASTIATYTSLSASAFLAETTAGTISSSQILVNLQAGIVGAKSSNHIDFSGNSRSSTANSEFELTSTLFSTSVIQVRGITDTTPVLDGGGTLNVYNVSSTAATPLTLSGGASYTIPASNLAVAGGIGGSSSNVIGYGVVAGSGSNSTGLAYSTGNHLVVPITYASSAVTPF